MSKEKKKSATGKSQFALVWHQFKKNKGGIFAMIVLGIIIAVAVAAPFIWNYETDICGMNTSQVRLPPSMEHFFGTDHMGRDVFARICYGAGYSLLIGFGGVAISTVFGVFFGAIAGFYGGKLEEIIMRIVEMFLLVPSIMLAIIVVGVFGVSLTNLIVAIGISTIPHFARNARAAVMTVCDNEYVEAARAIGEPSLVILFKHVLPNAFSPILVQMTTRIGTCITTAASFSFIGLGVPTPTPEWGSMLSEARQYMRQSPYLIIFPGLAIFITVLCVNLMGDALRDALDPKLKR